MTAWDDGFMLDKDRTSYDDLLFGKDIERLEEKVIDSICYLNEKNTSLRPF